MTLFSVSGQQGLTERQMIRMFRWFWDMLSKAEYVAFDDRILALCSEKIYS